MLHPQPSELSAPGGMSLRKARSYIHGGAVHRDDSDDELGDEDIPWEFIYETPTGLKPTGSVFPAGNTSATATAPSISLAEDAVLETSTSTAELPAPKRRGRPPKNKPATTNTNTVTVSGLTDLGSSGLVKPRIIGARLGSFECYVGDAVLLKADANEAWVGLLCSFFEDAENDNEKMGNFMWFSSVREVRNEKMRRTNVAENELYITPSWDDNPLTAINGKAYIFSPGEFGRKYPTGRIPKNAREFGKAFVCRFGCNTRTATYTKEFVWEDVYKGRDYLGDLIHLVQSQTTATRKSKGAGSSGLSVARAKIEKAKAKLKKRTMSKASGLEGIVEVSDDDAEYAAYVAGQETKRALRKRSKKGDDGDDEFQIGDDTDDDDDGDVFRTPRKRQRTAEPMSGSKRGGSGMTPRKKLLTPTHKRTIVKKPLEFTPLGSRILSTHALQSPFQQARNQLHVSSVPMSLPCREDEFAEVYTQLETAITDGSGSCIYIAGTPGTGKTATVREVVAQLNAAVLDEELDDFIFVEINGMKVTDPHQAYSLLWEALRGERVSPGQALRLLEAEFSAPSPRRVPCVVLMDELDQLVTKDQSVMYNFFNWPGLRHSRLIVLAVANTMDLPERTLSNKISSRLGLHRITFRGYTHEQLMQIIESRLANVPGNLVHPDAIQFASRKVAAVSGDARRALDICRRAVEIAEEGQLARQRKEEQEQQSFETQQHDMSIIHEEDEDGSDAERELEAMKTRASKSASQSAKPYSNTNGAGGVPATPSRSRTAPPIGAPKTPSRTLVPISLPPTPIRTTPLHKRAALPAIPGIVTIAIIKQAITEATHSPLQQSLRALPLSAKLFLAALIARSRRTGVQEAGIGDVIDEARAMAINMLGPAMMATSGVGSGSGVGMPVAYLIAGNMYLNDSALDGLATDSLSVTDSGDQALMGEYSNNSAPVKMGAGAAPSLGFGTRGKPKAKRVRNSYLPRLLGLRDAAQQLLDAGFVGLEARRGERVGRVRLGISEEEVGLALRGDGELVGMNLAFLNN